MKTTLIAVLALTLLSSVPALADDSSPSGVVEVVLVAASVSAEQDPATAGGGDQYRFFSLVFDVTAMRSNLRIWEHNLEHVVVSPDGGEFVGVTLARVRVDEKPIGILGARIRPGRTVRVTLEVSVDPAAEGFYALRVKAIAAAQFVEWRGGGGHLSFNMGSVEIRSEEWTTAGMFISNQ